MSGHHGLEAVIFIGIQATGKAFIPEKGVLVKYHTMQRPQYSEGFEQLYYVSIDPRGGFLVAEWDEAA